MNKHNKQELLDQIAADIVKDNVCPDLARTATNLVMGEGNPNAEIVFIGEAPGKNEDLQGRPFVGAAGKFLDEMLAAAGLERKNVYITSILKYRPPGNRDPKPSEKAAFWPYMLRQLMVIQPKIIVTLGRHSMKIFLPAKKISQVHGKPLRVRVQTEKPGGKVTKDGSGLTWVIMPLFHPAAALYNNSMRQTLIDDFMKLPATIKQLERK